MSNALAASKPDLRLGVPLDSLPDGAMLAGRAGDEDVLLVHHGDSYFAVGALCTHYHGELAAGILVGDTVRCPLHHACFSLRTGEALRAPALDPLPRWRVELIGSHVFVREKLTVVPRAVGRGFAGPILIIGGGAAGLAAAEMLRREGYDGGLTMFSADHAVPSDRPNLSKEYLGGTAPVEWVPVKPSEFYQENRIDLRLNAPVVAIDVEAQKVRLQSGETFPYRMLLLATGADPVHLPIPGAAPEQVHYLRTFDDAEAILAKVASAKRVLVIGSSFIGLEVAASMRARGLEVHVVAPDKVPLAKVLGADVGAHVQKIHEAHGVQFHLGCTVAQVAGTRATLSDGTQLDADFIVCGVGVRPSLTLAEQAGLTMDRGIAVDAYLETSVPGIYAAGDVARWPDPHSGEKIRVEHWVVAQRQGQVAAKNMLGKRVRFDAVPFFWSQHYDVAINYVGHAEKWDAIEVVGSLASNDCALTYKLAGRTLAVATIGRDRPSLHAEVAMEDLAISAQSPAAKSAPAPQSPPA
jgi:NADPH-dependent 2,4-dienoyl-CoA reductase/sulfur reductase-like enzyme/nitrite reductase/ring-hydroxylating ferredoxin subunit